MKFEKKKGMTKIDIPVDRNLVIDLLDKGTCICGCDLKVGSDHEKLLLDHY